MPEDKLPEYGSPEHIAGFVDYWKPRVEIYIRCNEALAEAMGWDDWREAARYMNNIQTEIMARSLERFVGGLTPIRIQQDEEDEEPWKS